VVRRKYDRDRRSDLRAERPLYRAHLDRQWLEAPQCAERLRQDVNMVLCRRASSFIERRDGRERRDFVSCL
jgi:hypothetical protein